MKALIRCQSSREDNTIITPELLNKYYPDNAKSGTLIFYGWIRAYLKYNFTALNIGAGSTSDSEIRSLKGEMQKVVGADIDSRVKQNRDVDESIIIKDNRLQFPDNTFDLVWSDFVQEHVECPSVYIQEIHRVLKPGASYFFRTPNKYHYVSLIARLTPQWFHKLAANKARGIPPDANELYPTHYRLNSVKAIKSLSKSAGFNIVELRLIEADPSYLMFHPVPFLLGVLYERLVNSSHRLSGVRANILGRLEK